ncbi:unannotated protein [freshwater metagenome]|uniref:Unannotated protein n=1 Tax=freshwater metagenome TaxID=449393 RepID=A0A6J6U0B6_9ZZZZ|nr:hypothetical protein [Actinomycetota bacterium]
MKLALVPIALVLGLSLAACGAGDPDDAGQSSLGSGTVSPGIDSEEEATSVAPFCEALLATASVGDGQDVADLRDSLAEAGLPEEAGEDAQAGLAVYLDVLDRVEPDATARDLATLEDPDLTPREQAQVDAMVGYATTACAAGAGQDPEVPESPSAE